MKIIQIKEKKKTAICVYGKLQLLLIVTDLKM